MIARSLRLRGSTRMSILLDGGLETPRYSPICTDCARLIGFRRCQAFDTQIPLAIWLGQNDHRRPLPGDHGLQFTVATSTELAKPSPRQEPDPAKAT